MAPVAQIVTAIFTSSAWFEGASWEPNPTNAGGPGLYVGAAPKATTAVLPSITSSSITPASSSSTCGAGYIPCPTPGAFVCANAARTKFGICNLNHCAIVQDLAPGVTCDVFLPSDSQPAPKSQASLVTLSASSIPVTSNIRTSSVEFRTFSTSSAQHTLGTSTHSSGSRTSAIASSASISTPAASASTSAIPTVPVSPVTYITYTGNGSTFPTEAQWSPSFDALWTLNLPLINTVCTQYGANSPLETSDLRSAILATSARSAVDARFILAVVMQESRGCVRVITTFGSHPNPGLLQSNQGPGTCRPSTGPTVPCPASEINQMIEDGTLGMQEPGLAKGDGLLQTYDQAASFDPVNQAVRYYIAARIYNSGSFVDDNLGCGVATHCYASDVANRLRGWSGDASPCSNEVVSQGCPSS